MPLKSPVDLFKAVLVALNAENWGGAAALCDPISLRVFRREMLDQFSPNQRMQAVTVEDMMRSQPELPRSVAEYYVQQQNERTDDTVRLRSQFPTVTNVNALRELEPAQLFAEFLYGRSPRRQIQALAAKGQVPQKAIDSGALEALGANHYQFETIGSLTDGDRIAHVFYRMKPPSPSDSPDMKRWLDAMPAEEQELTRDTMGREHLQSLTVRRQPDDAWLALASYQFIGGGMMISGIGLSERDEDHSEYIMFDEEPSP